MEQPQDTPKARKPKDLATEQDIADQQFWLGEGEFRELYGDNE